MLGCWLVGRWVVSLFFVVVLVIVVVVVIITSTSCVSSIFFVAVIIITVVVVIINMTVVQCCDPEHVRIMRSAPAAVPRRCAQSIRIIR